MTADDLQDQLSTLANARDTHKAFTGRGAQMCVFGVLCLIARVLIEDYRLKEMTEEKRQEAL